jgi:hypothetical protein
MGRIEKTEQRMRNNPGGWTIQDVRRIAGHYGIARRRPSGGSSHEVYNHTASPVIVSVPDHGKILPVYIKQFLRLVDAVKGAK